MQQHFVKIPKDLSLIKQKFIFGLTKRQAICFGIGLALGLATFFLVKFLIGNLSISIFAMGIIAGPAIFCGLYEKNGIHLEQQVKLMFEFFKKPKILTYQTENKFKAIERQMEYNRLKNLLINSGYTNHFENENKKVNLFEKFKAKK